jgi:hypothetical protein
MIEKFSNGRKFIYEENVTKDKTIRYKLSYINPFNKIFFYSNKLLYKKILLMTKIFKIYRHNKKVLQSLNLLILINF